MNYKKNLAWLFAVTMLSVASPAVTFADNSDLSASTADNQSREIVTYQDATEAEAYKASPADTDENSDEEIKNENEPTTDYDENYGNPDVEYAEVGKAVIKTGFSYTTSSITVRWEADENASGYAVSRYNSDSKEWETVAEVGNVTSYTDTGLEAGSSYTYSVTAFSTDSNGLNHYGEASDPLYAFTKCPTPQIDSNYTAKSNYAQFSWDSVSGADGYKVYRYNSKTKAWSIIATISDSSVTSYTDKNLSANTHYKYKVQAYRSYNGSQCHSEISGAIDILTAPATVSFSSGFGYTTSSVTCRWSSVDGATGYEVYRYDTASKKWVLLGTVTSGATSFTDSGLTAGESYRYIVRPFSENGGVTSYGYFGSELNAFAKCATAKISSTYSVGTDFITINWGKVNGASGYKVYRYNSKTKAWDRIATISNSSTLTYTDSKLSKNTTYQYKVQAYRSYNGAQCHGDMSTSASFSTASLSAPVTVSNFSYTTSSVTFRWNKVSGASGYVIYKYNSTTKGWDKLTTVSGVNNVSYTDKGLTAGGVYKYKIQAYMNRSNGSVVYSPLSDVLTTFAKCDKVTIKNYTVSANSVTINWSKINGAHGYKVYRYNTSTGKWDRIANLWGSDITSYQDKNVKSGTTYQYRVHAYRQYNGAHCHGDLSDTLTAKAQDMTVKVIVKDKSTNSVTLKWSKYSGSGYYVYQKINGHYELIATLKNADYTSYTVTGLTPGTRYYFAVRAFSTQNGATAVGSYGLSTASTYTYASSKSVASLPDLDTVVAKAATLLGTPYDFGSKGYGNVYYMNSTYEKTVSQIRAGGIDCTGLIYYTMMQLGYKTTGFAWNNLVPVDTAHWLTREGTCTITYNGKTTNVDVEKVSVSRYQTPYWQRTDGSTIAPGSVVVAHTDNGYDHGWIYIGEFNSRDDVVWYLKSLGISESLITTKTVASGNGTDGTHWRIESNGTDGVVINNNTTDATGEFISAFRIVEK